MIMNKEKEEKPKEIIEDIENVEEVEEYNIDDIIEGWDGSAYGIMKWSHEKKKWLKSKL